MFGFDEFVGFNANGTVLGIQLGPQANIRLGAAKPGAEAKEKQLVGFGIPGSQFIPGVCHKFFVGDTGGGLELHRACPLKIHRLEPIRRPFSELAVRHFEPGDFYREVGLVDDVRAEKALAVAQRAIERAINLKLSARITARTSQVGNLPIGHGGGRDG